MVPCVTTTTTTNNNNNNNDNTTTNNNKKMILIIIVLMIIQALQFSPRVLYLLIQCGPVVLFHWRSWIRAYKLSRAVRRRA